MCVPLIINMNAVVSDLMYEGIRICNQSAMLMVRMTAWLACHHNFSQMRDEINVYLIRCQDKPTASTLLSSLRFFIERRY